jgi:hypothetical protein
MSPDTINQDFDLNDQPGDQIPAEPSQEQASDIIGFIDAISGDRVFGWAWDRAHPADRLTVEVSLDDEVISTVSADELRDHLAQNNIGDGGHGFTVQLPERLAKEEMHRVSAVIRRSGYGGVTRLKNEAAVSTESLALRPTDFSSIVGQLEQCVSDQRAGFRWIYHELHELDQFVRNDLPTTPAIETQAAPIEEDDMADAICAIETQFAEMVQNQTVIQDTLEEVRELQKSLAQRLEQQDVFSARIDSRLEKLQDDKDEEPDFADSQKGLKRLILILGCLTIVSLATGIGALFF